MSHNERRTSRKPATKFAHLRKKMSQQAPRSKPADKGAGRGKKK